MFQTTIQLTQRWYKMCFAPLCRHADQPHLLRSKAQHLFLQELEASDIPGKLFIWCCKILQNGNTYSTYLISKLRLNEDMNKDPTAQKLQESVASPVNCKWPSAHFNMTPVFEPKSWACEGSKWLKRPFSLPTKQIGNRFPSDWFSLLPVLANTHE